MEGTKGAREYLAGMIEGHREDEEEFRAGAERAIRAALDRITDEAYGMDYDDISAYLGEAVNKVAAAAASQGASDALETACMQHGRCWE